MQCTVVHIIGDGQLELEREVFTVMAQPINGPVVIPEPSTTVFIIDINGELKLAGSPRGFSFKEGGGGGGRGGGNMGTLIRENQVESFLH